MRCLLIEASAMKPLQSIWASPRYRGQRGVSLIELMVGLLIGLLATLVIAQTLFFAEGYKRTTTSGADAQVNGALALYTLQRDLQMSGYGLTASNPAIGCEIRATRAGTAYTWTLAPVTITDGAGGLPDTINVMASDKAYSVPVRVTADHPSDGTRFDIYSTLGISQGDLMVAVPATIIPATNWCSVFNVTGIGTLRVFHAAGIGGPWNPAAGNTIFPLAGYPTGSYLVNVGKFLNRSYSIDNTTWALQRSSFDSASGGVLPADELFPQIINLQALYGKDTDGDGVIDSYDNTTPTTAAGWQQVLAVRIAVVARSATPERDDVTAAAPLWDVGNSPAVAGSAACAASRCLTLRVDHVGADWKRYRYKVFDTVVPLRNVLWRS